MDTPQKRALVTGAAGGLGRTVAIMLAERGCRVALADRDALGTRGDCAVDCRARRRDPFPHLRPRRGRRAGQDDQRRCRCLGRSRRAHQQRRLWRDRAFFQDDGGAMEEDSRHQRCRSCHADQRRRGRDDAPALGPHRQHHLACLPHGVAKLHRLCREQGGGRLDHARGRGGARAVRRARQQRRARHDGHRDAASH